MGGKESFLKRSVVIIYFCMLILNAISLALPINGRNVAMVAAYYPNFFTPSKFTFIIWLPVYLLLASFVIYQYILPDNSLISSKVLSLVRISFISYCVINFVWIFAWLYDYFALSTMIIFVVTVFLGCVSRNISREDLSARDRLCIRLPFSILYAWISMTTVINLVVLMYSVRWRILGLPHEISSLLIFASLTVIALVQTLINKDIAYCLTFIWSYIGILVKHISHENLDRPYPYAVNVLVVCIILLTGSVFYLLVVDRVHKRW